MDQQAPRSVFITGAGKGIGRAIAERFASDGWRVGGVTRSTVDVAALNALSCSTCSDSTSSRVTFYQGDASDPCDMAAAAEAQGKLDLLINNAGSFAYGGFRETDANLLGQLWQANVMTAFTATQAFLPALIRSGGRVANIISVAGIRPLAGKAAYSATKAAQAALFYCLRAEIAAEGVNVTNFYPGVTFTSSFDGEEVDPAQLLSPRDVAEAVFANCTADGNLGVEEVVLQPASGIKL